MIHEDEEITWEVQSERIVTGREYYEVSKSSGIGLEDLEGTILDVPDRASTSSLRPVADSFSKAAATHSDTPVPGNIGPESLPLATRSRCTDCGSTQTPLWRSDFNRVLCSACYLRKLVR